MERNAERRRLSLVGLLVFFELPEGLDVVIILEDVTDEGFVFDDLEGAVVMLDDGGKGFDPVTGVEVSDTVDHLISRDMGVTTDDAVALFFDSMLSEHAVILISEDDGGLDLLLDLLGDGVVFLTCPGAEVVVDAVDPEEDVVPERAEEGEPLVVEVDVVKAVPVGDEVLFPIYADVDGLFLELE